MTSAVRYCPDDAFEAPDIKPGSALGIGGPDAIVALGPRSGGKIESIEAITADHRIVAGSRDIVVTIIAATAKVDRIIACAANDCFGTPPTPNRIITWPAIDGIRAPTFDIVVPSAAKYRIVPLVPNQRIIAIAA